MEAALRESRPERSKAGSLARSTGLAGIVAAGLAGTALANIAAARLAERRHPPSGGFLDIDGVRLHYHDKGAGVPIALIHGNAVSGDDFLTSGLFEKLATRHRVIAIDRPGFGHSSRPSDRAWTAAEQADLLTDAFARMGCERPLVVGHSWGSLVACNIAVRHPHSVRGLVLMSGYYAPTFRIDALLTAPSAAPVLGPLLRYTVQPLLGRLMTPTMVRLLFSPAKVPARFRQEYSAGMAVRPSQLAASAAEGAAMVQEARRIQSALAELDLPILLIAGRADRIVSFRDQTEAFAKQLPEAQVFAIEGAGHMVHHVAPSAVAEAIDRFAATGSPAAGVNRTAGVEPHPE